MVLDNQTGPEYTEIADDPIFSSDGKRVAYCAQNSYGSWFAVIDGHAESFPSPLAMHFPRFMHFSQDGKHIVYVAYTVEKSSVVIDGQTGPDYDAIRVGPVFLKDGTVEYISQREGVLYRVNQRP
jgi:Tol biopolymer transport system component